VKQQLVLRLREPLAEELLADINEAFPDLLTDGHFEQRSALPLELDEGDIAHLPRLVFHFNRRNFGRLRVLIDVINRGTLESTVHSLTP
jgi:hypothetical protein